MNEKNWNSVLKSNDAQYAHTAFHNEFFNGYNICFPAKFFKRRYRTRKPWSSDGMKTSVNTKHKLYRRFKHTGNVEHEMLYKE